MKRERIAWGLSLVVLAIVAFRSPSAAQRDSDYLFVRTLVDIHRQVLNNYVEKVNEGKLEQACIDGMLNQLDPFTMYVPPAKREEFDRMLEGTFKGVGIQLNQLPGGAVEVVTPIDGSPAFKAGIKPGDIILKVNGQSIEGLRLPDVIKKIGGELGSEVRILVRHLGGKEVELKMHREEIVMPTVKGYQRKPDDTWDYYVNHNPKVAYLRLTQFTPTTFDTVRPILQDLLKDGMKALILDLRWNPGGQLDQAVQIVNMFVKEGTIVVTRRRNRPEDIKRATGQGTLPYFPMIVLVNEHSASAAEIVAGSLMDNKRAFVLGSRSYGKGSVQEVIPLEGNNGELKLTVAYYYLPSGRLVHRLKGAMDWGVDPQIKVAMDDESQRRVMDERTDMEKFVRPTTGPAKPLAATQSADSQLQRAINDAALLAIAQQQGTAPPEITAPAASQPTTRPTTRP